MVYQIRELLIVSLTILFIYPVNFRPGLVLYISLKWNYGIKHFFAVCSSFVLISSNVSIFLGNLN